VEVCRKKNQYWDPPFHPAVRRPHHPRQTLARLLMRMARLNVLLAPRHPSHPSWAVRLLRRSVVSPGAFGLAAALVHESLVPIVPGNPSVRILATSQSVWNGTCVDQSFAKLKKRTALAIYLLHLCTECRFLLYLQLIGQLLTVDGQFGHKPPRLGTLRKDG
jgi:hypothetical protein